MMLHKADRSEGKDLLSKVGVLYRKQRVWIINRNTLKKKYTICMAGLAGMCIFVPM